MTSSTPYASNSGSSDSHSSTRSTSSGAVRLKNDTRRWCCVRSSTTARSKCAEKMSRTKVRRAPVLLKADAAGPAWADARIAEAYGCRRQTVENLRQRLVTEGFESAVNGQARQPRPKVLDGTQ